MRIRHKPQSISISSTNFFISKKLTIIIKSTYFALNKKYITILFKNSTKTIIKVKIKIPIRITLILYPNLSLSIRNTFLYDIHQLSLQRPSNLRGRYFLNHYTTDCSEVNVSLTRRPIRGRSQRFLKPVYTDLAELAGMYTDLAALTGILYGN